MKVLKLLDGYVLNVSDESSITYLQTSVATFAEIDNIKAEFTEANFKRVELDGVVYTSIIPMSLTVEDGDMIRVALTTRELSRDEVRDMEISELQNAVMELAEIIGG